MNLRIMLKINAKSGLFYFIVLYSYSCHVIVLFYVIIIRLLLYFMLLLTLLFFFFKIMYL